MDKFRAALREEITEKLEYPPRVGEALLDAIRHRIRCIGAMTIGWSKASALQMRITLQLVDAGDWRETNIATYLRPGETQIPDDATYKAEVSQSMVDALVWHKFEIYRQDRWLGAEACVAQPTLNIAHCDPIPG